MTKFRFPAFSVPYDSPEYARGYPAAFGPADGPPAPALSLFCHSCGGSHPWDRPIGGVPECHCAGPIEEFSFLAGGCKLCV